MNYEFNYGHMAHIKRYQICSINGMAISVQPHHFSPYRIRYDIPNIAYMSSNMLHRNPEMLVNTIQNQQIVKKI